jgi:hypothetical protein
MKIDLGIQTISDFISRDCKSQLHESCDGKWEGLGFEIICSCKCRHEKNGQTLDLVEGPAANAIHNVQSNSKEFVQRK